MPTCNTGVTVMRPDARAVAAVAVGGGGPGTRETDALGPDTLVDAVDAIVFSGGSVYGLAAADGVAAALGAAGQGYALFPNSGVPPSPIVPAAILYDLANGGNKKWGETPPYRALGMSGAEGCEGGVRPRPCRAQASARGRGSFLAASDRQASSTHDGVVVGALAAVNAHGSVRMPGTDAFWAWPYEQDGEFGGARPTAGLQARPRRLGRGQIQPRRDASASDGGRAGRPHQHHARAVSPPMSR